MDDLISRQAAIDALNEQIEQCNKALGSFGISPKDEYAIKVERASLKAYKEQLENLPSAEPEIIHCKDCKWWDKSENSPYGYCMAMKHNYFSRNWEISIHRKYKGDFYCADAEREEE